MLNIFYGCSSLTSVTIPNSVTSIEYNAFRGCSGLTSITVASGNTMYDSRNNCNAIIESSSNKLVTGCNNTVIPSSVTDIGEYAFYDCSGLISATVPDGVTSIGDYAFYKCSGMTSLNIGGSVNNIGEKAFDGCTNLTSLTINMEDIGKTFHSYNFSSLTIGPRVTSISNYAFDQKPIKTIWLTNTPPSGYRNAEGTINYVSNDLYKSLFNIITYPFLSSIFEVDGIKYVPISPSERTCDALDCLYDKSAENLHIKNSVSYKGVNMTVKSINPYTFSNNDHIKNVHLEYGGNIGMQAFAECGSLESCTLGKEVTNISNSLFKNCTKLQRIIIPNSVERISEYAFSGCSSLMSAIIGNGVKTISQYAFQNCSALQQIEIPSSVTSIENYSFSGCESLAKIIICDRESELSLGSNGKEPLFADCPLESVYIGGNITYKTSSNEGFSPFYRNTSLQTIHITDKETVISENEFYGCTNLKNVRIGDGVTTIGNWAFSGCSSLDYFAFGSKVETIGQEAFSDCTAMTQLYSAAKTPPVCGSQALDDINKWSCTLHVPTGSVRDYQTANQWKEFFFIDEATKINDVTTESFDKQNVREIYDLQGKKHDSLLPGLNIIRMNDGTIKKIVVK